MNAEQQMARWAAKKFGLNECDIHSLHFEQEHETRAWSDVTFEEHYYIGVTVYLDAGKKHRYFELDMELSDILKEILEVT